MDINKKIEEIRKKPEHEKIRYVWGMVSVCMFFIIVLWFISLKSGFSGNASSNEAMDSSEDQINLGEISPISQ